jgi:hypothetical protein
VSPLEPMTCSILGHDWHEYAANLRRADVGCWRWVCKRCGAYRNDGGRVVAGAS